MKDTPKFTPREPIVLPPKPEPRLYRMTHFVRREGMVMYRLTCGHEVPRSHPNSIEEPCPTCG